MGILFLKGLHKDSTHLGVEGVKWVTILADKAVGTNGVEAGWPEGVVRKVTGGAATISTSSSLVKILGVASFGWGGGALIAVAGAPIEGLKHSFLAMAFLYWPFLEVSLFLAASQNLSAETFFMLARRTS